MWCSLRRVPSSPRRAALSVNPASVAMGEVPVGGAAATATLTLKNTGTTSMTITSATANGAGFSLSAPNGFIWGTTGTSVPRPLTLPLVVDAASTVTLTASFSATALGSQSGSVVFAFQKGTVASQITVPLSAIAVANTTLTPNPLALVFDPIAPGNSSQQTIQLTASGGDVNLTAAAISGTGFSLVSPPTLPVVVPQNTSISLTVQFAPAAGGAATGNLQLSSTACCATALNIPLSNLGGTETGGAGFVTILNLLSAPTRFPKMHSRPRWACGSGRRWVAPWPAFGSIRPAPTPESTWGACGRIRAHCWRKPPSQTKQSPAGNKSYSILRWRSRPVSPTWRRITPTRATIPIWPDFFSELGYTNLTGTLTAINDGLDGVSGAMLHTSVPAFPTGAQGIDPVYYPNGQSTNMLVDVVFNPDSVAVYTPLPPILQNLFPQGPDDQINTHLAVWATRGSTALSRAGSSATAWTTAAQAAQCRCGSPNGTSTSKLQTDAAQAYLLAWHQADEPDGSISNNNYTSVYNSLVNNYNTWTTAANAVGHPVHIALNFSAGFVPGLGGGCDMNCYHALSQGGDWIQSDVYPVSGFGRPDRLDWVGKSEDRKWQFWASRTGATSTLPTSISPGAWVRCG